MTFVVGLTGGIGSGKSAVSAAFAALGADIADADVVAHTVSARGQPGHAAIVGAFGPGVLDSEGNVDRARLRSLVFEDPAARSRLEAALHPLIRAAIVAEAMSWKAPYGVLVVPLLLERGGIVGLVDRILVVDCSEEEQVRRVMLRSGLAEHEVKAIMATQLPRGSRLAAADDVLDNSGPPDAIAPQVADLDCRYRALAAAKLASPSP